MRAVRAWEEVAEDDGGEEVREDVLDVRRRQEVAEMGLVVRCPRCRAALVARMGRRGPCFPCRCNSGEGGRA